MSEIRHGNNCITNIIYCDYIFLFFKLSKVKVFATFNQGISYPGMATSRRQFETLPGVQDHHHLSFLFLDNALTIAIMRQKGQPMLAASTPTFSNQKTETQHGT
jgi:hypothetical protein